MSAAPVKRRIHELESYFSMTVDGVDCIARVRIDQPGKIWIHRNCIWELLL